MTQPLFQHRLPFGLAPFQKPSPSTPFFPAFLLPPPPRLTVTLKQPPLPTPRFPPPPQTPSSGPWDAGELWHLPLILIQRSCFWNWRVRLWCLPAEEEVCPLSLTCRWLGCFYFTKAHSFLQSWKGKQQESESSTVLGLEKFLDWLQTSDPADRKMQTIQGRHYHLQILCYPFCHFSHHSRR
nr:uncharacterized protein LOC102067133 isoform X2 [Zonotrichia albicollis]